MSRSVKMNILKLLFKIYSVLLVILIVALTMSPVSGQDLRDVGLASALEMRKAVVSLSAVRQDGSVHHGFGIITGEYEEDTTGGILLDRPKKVSVLVVTPNHLIRDKDGKNPAKRIEVRYFKWRGAPGPAVALDHFDAFYDVTVLKAEPPSEFRHVWSALGCITDLQAGDSVRFIGRAGQWYIQDPPGKFVSVDNYGRVTVEGLNVSKGSSGGPILSPQGIVAMLVTDRQELRSKGTSMDRIRQLVQKWNLPWGLYRAIGQLPCMKRFPETKEGVESWLWEMLQPSTPIWMIATFVVPNRNDCAEVFAPEYSGKAETFFRKTLRMNEFKGQIPHDNTLTLGSIGGFEDPGSLCLVAECTTTDELKRQRLKDYEKQGEIVKSGFTVCQLGHCGRRKKHLGSFIYVNGRWKFFQDFISFIMEVSPYTPPRRGHDFIPTEPIDPSTIEKFRN